MSEIKLPYGKGIHVRVTSPFGNRTDPISGTKNSWHGGIDLVSDGDKTVRAVVGGDVWLSRIITDSSNRTSEWGNYICICGDDGTLYYYCHLSKRVVSAGERVESGQTVGVEGSTGRSTGSHLHFEIRRDGVQVDPTEVLGIPNACGVYVANGGEIMTEANKNIEQNDSKPQGWAKEAVEWAIDSGIIFGDENGDLMLRKACTREQMLVFIHRLATLLEG